MASVLELSNGGLTATVRPEMGGAITAFRIQHGEGAVDLLRPASRQALASNNALDSSSYPLVPYSNRIENGLLRFGGQTWRSERTFPDHPHTLHGHGYKNAWAVDAAASSSGALSFDYEGPDFPGTYRAVQVFSLSERSLNVEMSVKNTGRVPMPAGLGFHPFFPKPADTQLEISLGGVWLMAANDGIPTERVPVPPEWDFRRMREIGDVVLDHCFTDWEPRRAVIAWPSRGLRVIMTAGSPMNFIVIYSPQGEQFFCVEPVTHMNNAFNRAERGESGTGTRILEPGQELTAKMSLEVERT